MDTLDKLAPYEMDAVAAISKRASKMFDTLDAITIVILVAEVHRSIPLRLQDLVEADDFNFSHDISGICRHWDRAARAMQNCFRPRFAA